MTPGRKVATAAALLIAAGLVVIWAVQHLQGEDSAVSVTGTIEGLQVDVSAKIPGRNAAPTREWTEKDRQRIRELYSKELVSAQEVDRARQAYEVALANDQSARERLSLLEAGPRQHEVQAARHDLEAARERVRLLRA